jgi:hypothetical protein
MLGERHPAVPILTWMGVVQPRSGRCQNPTIRLNLPICRSDR